MKKIFFIVMPAMLLMSGCAHVISDQSMGLVDRTIAFGSLRENPEAFIGKYVLLGGSIVSTKNTNEGGELEVVQLPLDSSGSPEDSYNSGGRFLAVGSGFLDPAIYKQGRMVTVVGEVKGKRGMPLDEVEYTYPVIAIRELYLWKPSEIDRYYYPSHGYYYPYYWYDPWFDPWWPYWYHRPGPFRR
ncbi:MAG: outer membrane [Geobacteraceae bacterium]|nr:MAG: outer membrane [Geobacteraceae bacterium]